MAAWYPVYLNLEGRSCVVIGGGREAERKVLGLREAGGRVTVISPTITPRLEEMAGQGLIQVVRRSYKRGDLDGSFLAIAAGEDRRANREIWQEAEQGRVVLNAVDDMPHCHFIAPAIYRQGDLTVAISTAGKSPALGVRIRNGIAALIGPEYAAFLDMLGDLRSEMAAREPDPMRRTALWYRIVDSDAIQYLRRGDVLGARQRIMSLLDAGERIGIGEPMDAGEPTGHPKTGAPDIEAALARGDQGENGAQA